jgi:hypothetical protein
MRFCLIKREEGSITPLILGFAIIIASIIATLSDITYLGNAHLSLKSEGQRVLAEALRNVSSVDYYQGNSEVGRSVPIDCQNTYFNILREGFDDSKIKKEYKLIHEVTADKATLVYIYQKK